MKNNIGQFLKKDFKRLYTAFGPQHWWPAETPFEVAVGAILTQNTNWKNVERAINALKSEDLLNPYALHQINLDRLARVIKPAGYYNIKARRLKAFVDFLITEFDGMIEKMAEIDINILRERLLRVDGIGPETADSVLLYALQKPVFVVDAYTKRVLSRHGIINHDAKYEHIQSIFHKSLPRDVYLFNEYHALFVKLGKTFCKTRPLCEACPLRDSVEIEREISDINERDYKKKDKKGKN